MRIELKTRDDFERYNRACRIARRNGDYSYGSDELIANGKTIDTFAGHYSIESYINPHRKGYNYVAAAHVICRLHPERTHEQLLDCRYFLDFVHRFAEYLAYNR